METGQFIIHCIKDLSPDAVVQLDINSPLVGAAKVIDSRRLVELCLRLEDYATEQGFESDWTSAAAMSESQSIFRTVDSLAKYFDSKKGTA